MASVVLAVAARSGDRALFDRLHDEAKRATDRERRERLLDTLGSFRSPGIVPLVLGITLEDEIDLRESIGVAFTLSSDPASRDAAYKFVKAHYNDLSARLSRGSVFDVPSFLPFVGAGFCDEPHRRDVEAFFAPKVEHAAGAPRNLAQTLEEIDLCIAQRRVQEPSVTAFLDSAGAESRR
jgi:alanyl aminopeptidase